MIGIHFQDSLQLTSGVRMAQARFPPSVVTMRCAAKSTDALGNSCRQPLDRLCRSRAILEEYRSWLLPYDSFLYDEIIKTVQPHSNGRPTA